MDVVTYEDKLKTHLHFHFELLNLSFLDLSW